MFSSTFECSWCTLEKKELIKEAFVAWDLVDPNLFHLDLSFGGIKFES